MREIKFRAWDTELKMMVYENEQTGDIGYEKGKIIFDCGCYFVNYGWNTHLLFEFLNDIKVVGNIYENPELLEEINNGKR